MRQKSCFASVVLGLLLSAHGGAREWTDSTGAFTVEATLVEVLEDSVRLRKRNGILVQVPIERLCRADQLYVRSIRQTGNLAVNETLAAIDKALETKMSFDFVDAELWRVARYVSELNDIDVEIDVGELDNRGIGTDQPVTLQKENMVLADALGLLLEPLKLAWVVRDDVLLITAPEETEAELETRVYVPTGNRPLDTLIADITKNVEPRRWSELGGPGAICKISSGVLIISQTYQCHREIENHCKDTLRVIRPSNMAIPSSVLPEAVASALNVRTPVYFIETPLEDAIQFLSKTSGAGVSLDKEALSEVGLGLDVPITRKLERVRFRCALRHILKDLELTWYPDDEGIVITTPERAETHMQLARYHAKGLTKDPFLGDLIGADKKTIAPQAWDDVGGPSSVKRGDGNTIEIRTTWGVHAKVEQLMQDLRQAVKYTRR